MTASWRLRTRTRRQRAGRDPAIGERAKPNVREFLDSIPGGSYLNDAAGSVDSKLTRIPARTASCHRGAAAGDEIPDLPTRLDAGRAL